MKEENGDESVQMVILLPIILFVVMFIMDVFIQYEGLTCTTVSTNEALRMGVVQEGKEDAKNEIVSVLEDRFSAQAMGWCATDDVSRCIEWKASGGITENVETFNHNSNMKLLVDVSNNNWCNGNYLTVGVRVHKASLLPSYSNFRRLITQGGPIYHTHKYIIKGRIESENLC